MLKHLEVSDPKSCLNTALDGERVFVLLGRDPAAPHAIREWASRRVVLQKNDRDDTQIVEAMSCADAMERDIALVRAMIEHDKTAKCRPTITKTDHKTGLTTTTAVDLDALPVDRTIGELATSTLAAGAFPGVSFTTVAQIVNDLAGLTNSEIRAVARTIASIAKGRT